MDSQTDLTGLQFGRWTVISKADDRLSECGRHYPMWNCECECGKRAVVYGKNLIKGYSKSCGCLRRDAGKENLKDLAGKRFGRLTVLRQAESQVSENGSRSTMWECLCDCGKETVVSGAHLQNGHTKSCGCLALETKSRRSNNDIHYEFKDDYVIGYTRSGEHFIFDPDDFETVSKYCWSIANTGYVAARGSDGKIIHLHRLVSKATMNMVVDHINHDKLDNRKCNLRAGEQKINVWNMGLRRNNTSGVTGVSFDNSRMKWHSTLVENGIFHYLGRFDSFDDAVAARKAAEEKYFGEYSYDNSIASVPRIAV